MKSKNVVSRKGWVTRIVKTLNGALKAKEGIEEVEDRLAQLNIKLEALEDTQRQHERVVDNESLEKFSGNVTEWPTWFENFQAMIEDTELPDITKFSYLQSLLEGEASVSIKGLPLTAKNYKVAVDILKDRFGRKELIINGHVQSLMNLEGEGKNTVMKLRSIRDQTLIHVRSLESQGVHGETYGIFMTPIILSRLPADVRMEWAREGDGKEGDLDFLMKFMKIELERRERAENFRTLSDVHDTRSDSNRVNRSKVPMSSASALSVPPPYLSLLDDGFHEHHSCVAPCPGLLETCGGEDGAVDVYMVEEGCPVRKKQTNNQKRSTCPRLGNPMMTVHGCLRAAATAPTQNDVIVVNVYEKHHPKGVVCELLRCSDADLGWQ
jgi:hypothetical protein